MSNVCNTKGIIIRPIIHTMRTIIQKIRQLGQDLCRSHVQSRSHVQNRSPMQIPLNTKGFTMVELVVVIFLVAIMATIAISSYVNSTDTFNFLANYKNVMSSIRTVRSYAITNKQIGNEIPDRYGVKIEADKVIAFADDNGNFAFDDDVDTKIKEYTFTKYVNEVQDSELAHNPIAMPVKIFYASGSGELTIFDGNDNIVDKNENKYVVISFAEIADGSAKYIVIFQVSGLPEEFSNLNADVL